MKFLEWFRSGFKGRYRLLWKYRRGMSRANRRDHQGALEDYTDVIDTCDAPQDVKAMALFNRALVYSAQSQDSSAIEDLQELLALPAAGEAVKIEARRKLVRIGRASTKNATECESAN